MLTKISLTEQRSNQEVLDMVNENRRLMNTISDKDRIIGEVMCREVNPFFVQS